ncbi:MAG: hypothetical protein RID91_07175 [Azospirillaceae bacterium]
MIRQPLALAQALAPYVAAALVALLVAAGSPTVPAARAGEMRETAVGPVPVPPIALDRAVGTASPDAGSWTRRLDTWGRTVSLSLESAVREDGMAGSVALAARPVGPEIPATIRLSAEHAAEPGAADRRLGRYGLEADMVAPVPGTSLSLRPGLRIRRRPDAPEGTALTETMAIEAARGRTELRLGGAIGQATGLRAGHTPAQASAAMRLAPADGLAVDARAELGSLDRADDRAHRRAAEVVARWQARRSLDLEARARVETAMAGRAERRVDGRLAAGLDWRPAPARVPLTIRIDAAADRRDPEADGRTLDAALDIGIDLRF